MLSGTNNSSHPLNIGDLFAFLSGILFSCGSSILKHRPDIKMIPLTSFVYIFTSFGAFLLIIFISNEPLINIKTFLPSIPYVFMWSTVILLTSFMVVFKVSQILFPGRVAILLMSEVVVAIISASVLVPEERMFYLQWLGALAIITAGFTELVIAKFKKKDFRSQFMKKINDLFLMTIANSSGSGITAVFWFILAALMIPSEYGQIQYFISIAGLAYTISLLGTQSVITVYTAKKVELQATLTTISLIIGTISGGIILLIFSKVEISFLVIAFILNDIGLGYILGKKFFVTYSKYFILQKSLTFVLGISFYFLLGPEGIIFGIVLSYIHFLIIILKILKQTKINFPLLRNRIGFVSNNYSINIIGIAKNNLDKIIIMPLVGFEILGNYALALQVFFVFSMFSKIIYNYTLPHDSTGDPKSKIKIVAILFAIGITIFGITVVPMIMPIVFPDYVESVIAIQVISLAVVPSTVTLMLSSKILGNEDSKIILVSRIVFASTIISLIVILTPIYGIVGATSSFVVASSFQSIILFIYQRNSNNPKNRN